MNLNPNPKQSVWLCVIERTSFTEPNPPRPSWPEDELAPLPVQTRTEREFHLVTAATPATARNAILNMLAFRKNTYGEDGWVFYSEPQWVEYAE